MILYLGLDPSRYPAAKPIVHYPIIEVKKNAIDVEKIRPYLLKATRILFTSRSAVMFWKELFPIDQEVIVTGEATRLCLPVLQKKVHLAKTPCQEGVVEVLKKMDWENQFLLYPHSAQARKLLLHHVACIPSFSFPLYRVHCKQTLPPLKWDLFDEIVFTSPSTVDSFLQLIGAPPSHCHCTAIGPITFEALKNTGWEKRFSVGISDLFPH